MFFTLKIAIAKHLSSFFFTKYFNAIINRFLKDTNWASRLTASDRRETLSQVT